MVKMSDLKKLALLLSVVIVTVVPSLAGTFQRYSKSSDIDHTENNRRARLFNLFTVYRFPNNPCSIQGSTRSGVCLTEAECRDKNGTSSGSCADNYGVCCLVTLTQCGQSSKENVTVWTQPGSSFNQQQTCSVLISKVSPDICQYRVDFLTFVTQQPTDGDCNMDRFTISGQDSNSVVPTICGTNTGQHFYLNVGSSQGPIIFNMVTSGTFSRTWEIQISQIRCSASVRAPQGCLQYYTGAAGVIQSFNYGSATDTYLNNLEYTICYRKELGFCSFTLEVPTSTATDIFSIEGGTANNAGVGDTACANDYLIVANRRLCGQRLNDGTVTANPSTTNSPAMDATTGPFLTTFKSNDATAQRGFQLNFRQNPCGFVGK